MQRGIYFDGWHRGHHCYHPSLPTRRLSQVNDIERHRGTMLVWSALGGGSISLPFLEHEIDGPVAPRDRMYGALTDREFIAECGKRGIKVFGIVFEAQGWEFGVELNDDESEILAFNELRGVGKPAELGLREFTQDRYPKLWKSFSHYFPDGLVNSDGETVTDLFEECAARGLDGSAYHARWVESPDAAQNCHYMDRNNPVWREYLKAIIRLQIDAGVHGVQLDEASTPLGTMQYGACFCKDCVRGFREHLASLDPAALQDATGGEPIDVASFDYRRFLLDRGLEPVRHPRRHADVPRLFRLHADIGDGDAQRAQRLRPRLRPVEGPRGAGQRQHLQHVPVFQRHHRAPGRDRHRSAQPHLQAARVVSATPSAWRSAATSWWSRTPMAASSTAS